MGWLSFFRYTFWYTFRFPTLLERYAKYAIFCGRITIFFMQLAKYCEFWLGSTPLGSTILRGSFLPTGSEEMGFLLALADGQVHTLVHVSFSSTQYVFKHTIDDLGGTVLLTFDLMAVNGECIHAGRVTNDSFQKLHGQI